MNMNMNILSKKLYGVAHGFIGNPANRNDNLYCYINNRDRFNVDHIRRLVWLAELFKYAIIYVSLSCKTILFVRQIWPYDPATCITLEWRAMRFLFQAEFPIPCTCEELDGIRTWVDADETVSKTAVAQELGEAAFAAAHQARTFTLFIRLDISTHFACLRTLLRVWPSCSHLETGNVRFVARFLLSQCSKFNWSDLTHHSTGIAILLVFMTMRTCLPCHANSSLDESLIVWRFTIVWLVYGVYMPLDTRTHTMHCWYRYHWHFRFFRKTGLNVNNLSIALSY